MKYLQTLLARRAEASDQPAASSTARQEATDKTAKSPALAAVDPFVSFVSADPEHLACRQPEAPLPEWPRIGGDLELNQSSGCRIEAFEERAAIMEFDAALPREEAERRADPEVADYFKPSGLLDWDGAMGGPSDVAANTPVGDAPRAHPTARPPPPSVRSLGS